jgi:hypothetical protein
VEGREVVAVLELLARAPTGPEAQKTLAAGLWAAAVEVVERLELPGSGASGQAESMAAAAVACTLVVAEQSESSGLEHHANSHQQ